eukprot:GHVS01099102.1.p1 GENE.GHVS01099102.1~~GHVS01099102.1.p1  ORF type:complete len:476 (+),score=76.49 GHVS01099102.1:172-1599(+)
MDVCAVNAKVVSEGFASEPSSSPRFYGIRSRRTEEGRRTVGSVLKPASVKEEEGRWREEETEIEEEVTGAAVGAGEEHICRELDMEQSMWQLLEPYGCQQCLNNIKICAQETTVHVGLWSDQAVACGMPLPIGLSFIDEYVAKNFSPRQLETVRDRYLQELKSRLPVWLKSLETDEGWKYHGTKNGNVFHRREPKGEPPIIRGRMNMGSALNLQEYNDINMDRDFYPNLYKDSKALKHFKPAVTWSGSLEQPWFLNLSWLCYNGFPPIVSDRELLTASLVVFLDKHTTVTVSMSVHDFDVGFPEKTKNAIPVNMGAIFKTCQLADNTVEHCGVVQASMRLLVPQCIFIRSSLFTQPVDWPAVMQYAQSERGRAAIGKHPVCSLVQNVAEGIDARDMWLEGKRKKVRFVEDGSDGVCRTGSISTTDTTGSDDDEKREEEQFDPWAELQSVTAKTLCEYATKKKGDGTSAPPACGGQ